MCCFRFRRFTSTVFATNSPGDGQSCVRKSVLKRRREAEQVVDVLCKKEIYGKIVVRSGSIEQMELSSRRHGGHFSFLAVKSKFSLPIKKLSII